MAIDKHALARQFLENGIKLLLEHPTNVSELFGMVRSRMLRLVDLNRLRRVQTTFVKSDYRHVESDVVFVAPLRRRGKGRARKLLIYILIEHQSQPDRLMPLRLLDYVVQIFNYQTRGWAKKHNTLTRIRFDPVLPVVFYTGTRRWDSVGRLVDLVHLGEHFESATPLLEPLFINLPEIDAEVLKSQGGFFGWVLRLIQQRKARLDEFRQLVEDVVRQLESMPEKERLRWLQLLSYIVALIYHERDHEEIAPLQDTIEASVKNDSYRKEVAEMGKSYAEVLVEQGREEGTRTESIRARRLTLLRLLRSRFGKLPAKVGSVIEAASDVAQLDAWLDQLVVAKTLDEVGIS